MAFYVILIAFISAGSTFFFTKQHRGTARVPKKLQQEKWGFWYINIICIIDIDIWARM